MKNLWIGAAIALLMFGTVPLAELAGRHNSETKAGTAGQTIADGIGSVVTNLVETHKRMSVAISDAAK